MVTRAKNSVFRRNPCLRRSLNLLSPQNNAIPLSSKLALTQGPVLKDARKPGPCVRVYAHVIRISACTRYYKESL